MINPPVLTYTPPVTAKVSDAGENDRVKYASSTMQGARPSMEDALAVELDLDETTSFFGVYDGHGGAKVAMYCAKQFHNMLLRDEDFLNNLPKAIKSVCSRLDDDLRRSNAWSVSLNPHGSFNCFQFLNTGVFASLWRAMEGTYVPPLHEGSTACVVTIRGNQIIVGNVGDSRCVLSRNGQAIALSIDHKPTIPNECERILRAGGQLLRPDRVETGPSYVQGMLAMSRAIGDFALKQNRNMLPSQQMVTCIPDIRGANITDDTEFLVIASDGVWDHMSNKQVVSFVRQKLRSGRNSLGKICEMLLDRCLPPRDNATVILVQFKHIAQESNEVADAISTDEQLNVDNPISTDEQLNVDNPISTDDQSLALLFGPP
ncbi:probable protein phosphatase 2C 21 [Oryza brachyantha]|uniref:probable protein phosphatase 2C 21 n=1 Tax=Oryza brachyantha TaxID=4533 RepID=UPI001ADB6E98|nr:probable protein phosphatase 2C 21 [Oryza brachyantha]